MKLSTFAIIIAILSFAFGLGFVLSPVNLLAHYGISLDSGGAILGRYFGVSTLFLGAIFWFNRQIPVKEKSWHNLLLCNLLYNILQLIITIMPVLSGEANSLGWTSVAIFFLFAIGSVYFLMQNIKANNKTS